MAHRHATQLDAIPAHVYTEDAAGTHGTHEAWCPACQTDDAAQLPTLDAYDLDAIARMDDEGAAR